MKHPRYESGVLWAAAVFFLYPNESLSIFELICHFKQAPNNVELITLERLPVR